jgi:uncharacterized YigZ family protein
MIRTINEYVTNSIVVEKSKFICEIFIIANENEAKSIINKVKLAHPKARHHCYAYILKNEYQNIENQSDDGEPSKTAGLPMLEILRHEHLVNVLVIVTRYFGGILLGTGGLIRAYSLAVKECVNKAEVRDSYLYYGYKIEVSYHNSDKLQYQIKAINGIIISVDYQEMVVIECYFKQLEDIINLNNKFNDELTIIKLENSYM